MSGLNWHVQTLCPKCGRFRLRTVYRTSKCLACGFTASTTPQPNFFQGDRHPDRGNRRAGRPVREMITRDRSRYRANPAVPGRVSQRG
jgi:ribosomal protein L37E